MTIKKDDKFFWYDLCKSFKDLHLESVEYDIILEGIGAVALALVGFYLLLSPKFPSHPYRLIGITCLFESNMFWPGILVRCNNIENEAFFLTGFTSKSWIRKMNQLSLKFYTIIIWESSMGVVVSNMLIFYDLIKTLQNPFVP